MLISRCTYYLCQSLLFLQDVQHSIKNYKIHKDQGKNTTHSQETKQSTEIDSEITQIMVLSYRAIKITKIHVKESTRKGGQRA